MTNMATICSSLLDNGDVPLTDIHDNFVETFLSEHNRHSIGGFQELFMSLKTQVCIEKMRDEPSEYKRADIVMKIFNDMEPLLKHLRPDNRLHESDHEFLDMMTHRRLAMLHESRQPNTTDGAHCSPPAFILLNWTTDQG
jgi:hypothetical protein